MRLIIVLCAVLGCAAAAAGEVYKWKDKDGRIHYGDKPKTGQGESIMVAPDRDGEPSAAAADDGASRDAECKQKKARLESYRAAPSISEIDNLGKTREYSAAERKQYLEQEQARVNEACAPRAPSPEAAGTFPPPEVKQEPIAPRPEEEPPPPPAPG